MATSYLEPIPPALHDLLKLLDERLPRVPLPEADGRSLQELAVVVKDAARAARDLDEAAERAYRDLAVQQRDLLKKAARARAYARIFAADDAALLKQLDAIDLPVDESDSFNPGHVAPSLAPKKRSNKNKKEQAKTAA